MHAASPASNAAIDLPRSSPLEDAALVRAVLGGDRPSFAVLMRRYNQRVFRIARGILKSDADAEDAAQDAWVIAFQKLGQLDNPAAFGGWVARIAANGALLRLRRRRALQGIIERQEVAAMYDDRAEPSPDDTTHRGELRALLEAAIDRLPEIYRAVLIMRDVESMSTAETAAALDLEPAAIRVRLHRARRMMRDRLDHDASSATAGVYAFDGARCDRMVAAVFRRLS